MAGWLHPVLQRDEISLLPEKGINLYIVEPTKNYEYPVHILVAFSTFGYFYLDFCLEKEPVLS